MGQLGIFARVRRFFFGDRPAKLRERTAGAHWLSYVLIGAQSLAVLLALGHNQIALLYGGDLVIRSVAAMVMALLVATVYAADLCLIATMQRLPVLWRNRQTVALWEHLLYAAFVFAVEGSTLVLVLYTLDVKPAALISADPIIPTSGVLFALTIAGRAALTVWTSVQLLIVRGTIAPQWSTLIARSMELVGGHANTMLGRLDMSQATLAAVFAAYAAMSAPPVRPRTWWNGWLIRRERDAAEREGVQRSAVVEALAAFESAPASTGRGRGPTGPGSPTANTPAAEISAGEARPPIDMTARTGRRSKSRRTQAAAKANTDRRTDAEKQSAAFGVIEAYSAEHGKPPSNRVLAAAAKVSVSAASTYLREYPARRPAAAVQEAQGAAI